MVKIKQITIITLLLIILSLSVSAQSIDLDANITVYYSFDTDCTDSFGSNDCNATGVAQDTGFTNDGYRWDGGAGDYVLVPKALTNSRPQGSISFMLRTDDNAEQYNVFAKSAASMRSQLITAGNDEPSFSVSGEGPISGAITASSWTHLVYTWNSTNKTIYANNTLIAQASGSYTTPASGHLYLGQNSVNGNEDLKGMIDEFYIFNKALGPAEINELYDNMTQNDQYPLTEVPATISNFTITAYSFNNNNTINTFNATVNGTLFQTTTGSINTNISNNTIDLINITVSANGLQDNITLNYNISVSGNLNASLQQDSYTGLYLNHSSDDYRVGQEMDMTCNYANPSGLDVNITYYITNANDTTTVTQLNNATYLINNTDFLDVLQPRCEVCTVYLCENSSTNDTSTEIDMVFTFNVVNDASQTLTNINLFFEEDSISTSTTPLQLNASQLLNTSNKLGRNVTINATDNTNYHINQDFLTLLNESTETYTINMTRVQMYLAFQQNGAAITVNGAIQHSDREEEGFACIIGIQNCGATRNFNATQVLIVQQTLGYGEVEVRFNPTDEAEWTQRYEYLNDFSTHINETMEILNDNSSQYFFRILGASRYDIQDAVIRVYGIRPNGSTNDQQFFLYHQLLSNSDGREWFYFDQDMQMYAYVYKDGYLPQTIQQSPWDEFGTWANPLEITLRETDSEYAKDNTFLTAMDNYYYPTTTNIYLMMVSFETSQLQFTTEYMTYNETVTEHSLGLERYLLNLSAGTHFPVGNTDNITITIYKNGAFWNNVTIQYDNATKHNIFEEDDLSSVSDRTKRSVALILILLITASVGLLFNNEDFAVASFKIGAVVITSIIPAFFWVVVIIALEEAMKIIKRMVME